jgi:hypothetical protein
MRRSRHDVEALARRAGLIVLGSPCDADVLVCADACRDDRTVSRKLRIARERNIPIVSETDFFAQVHAPAPPPALQVNYLLRGWRPKRTRTALTF